MNAVVSSLAVTWEKLPADYVLDDEPVDNRAQPLLAMALMESLSVAGRLPATALTTTNYAICATVNGRLVVKAPDWSYVPAIRVPPAQVERSYTPHLEGDKPLIVMEFLSATDGGEYARDDTYPYGKWFFYEQILQVPYYALFDPSDSTLEVHRLDDRGHYAPQEPNNQQRYWIGGLDLYLGVWWGTREGRIAPWLRWWDKRGRLLPWREELLAEQQQRAEQAMWRAEQAQQRAGQERQRAEEERQRAEQERQRAEQAQQRAEQAQRQVEQAQQRAEQAQQRAEQAQRQVEQEWQRAEQAEQARRNAVPRLLAAGLSTEQVAVALNLTVAEVNSLSGKA
jgi:Uma2 family endonuclease